MIIKKHDFGNIEAYRLLNKQSGEFVEIITGFGAVLNNFVINTGSSLQSIIDGYDSQDDLQINYNQKFKGAKLFPFANRIKNGKYNFNGREYQLNMNFPHENNSIHGFLLDKKFEVADQTADEFQATLGVELKYKGNEPGFPFRFNIRLNYTLTQDNHLTLETIIKNVDNITFPIVDGWHPYFTFGDNIDNVQLELKSLYTLEVDNCFIPTGTFIEHKEFNKLKQIGESCFDNCFRVKENGGMTKTVLFNPVNSTGIEIWQETGEHKYNFVQVYIPPSRKSIAIEPMTAPPDAFNNQQDIIVLQPSTTIRTRCGININKMVKH